MRIPPVVIFLVPVLIGWMVGRILPSAQIAFPGQFLFAILFLLAGAAILFVAVFGFRRKGTTVDPINPGRASALVTSGIYKITRNPMYLGMALVSFGFSLWFGWLAGLVSVFAAIAYVNEAQIKPEEAALMEIFGAEYEAYTSKVHRWI